MGRQLELFAFNITGSPKITDLGGFWVEDYVNATWPEMEDIQKSARIAHKPNGQRPILNDISSALSLSDATEVQLREAVIGS